MTLKDIKSANKFLLIFGLLFFVSGLGVNIATTGMMTVKYFATSNWQKTPAQLTMLDLKVRRGESTTYTVKTKYSYYFQGAQYEGDRVALRNGSDNIGSYWQDIYRQLQQDRSNGTVTAWVNPSEPNEALLDRTFRWSQVIFGLVFLVMFCIPGFGIMLFAAKAGKPEHEVRQEAKQYGFKSNEKVGHRVLFWFGSIFFSVGVLILSLLLPDIINEGEYGGLALLLFVIAGGWIMAWALKIKKNYQIIGPSPLFISPFPGIIGGQVGGAFKLAARTNNQPINIVLTCKKKVKSGKKTRTTLVWQDTMPGYVETTSSGSRVSFVFDCPADLPGSTPSSIFWEVRAEGQVSAQAKTIPLERNWIIPVENATAVASTVRIPEQFLRQQEQLEEQAIEANATDLIQFKQQGRFLEVDNVGERPIGSAFFLASFGLVFGGAGVFTITQDWWPGYIFAVVGAIFIYSGIFLLGRDIDIKVDIGLRTLYMRRKWFGIVLYKRKIMLFEPSQFSIKKTSSSSDRKTLNEYYKVEVKDKDKKILLAEGIKGKDLSEAIMNDIIEKAFPERY